MSLTILVAAVSAGAQNPIASKATASSAAMRNRLLLLDYGEVAKPGKEDEKTGKKALSEFQMKSVYAAAAPGQPMLLSDKLKKLHGTSTQIRQVHLEVNAVLRSEKLDTMFIANGTAMVCVRDATLRQDVVANATSPEAELFERLCRVADLRPILLEAAAHVMGALGQDLVEVTSTAALESEKVRAITWNALLRTLDAVERGHTNSQRWFVGGQLGMEFVRSGEESGSFTRASTRATYFVPISPLRMWQLPIVTNLGDFSKSDKEANEKMLQTLSTSSSGAFLSVEPTFKPQFFGSFMDIRYQPFVALSGHLLTLKASNDSSVRFGQARFAVGSNFEFGVRDNGAPGIFVSSRIALNYRNAATYERAFGVAPEKETIRMAETVALIPLTGGTALLFEWTASQFAKPFFRVALWTQATSSANGSK